MTLGLATVLLGAILVTTLATIPADDLCAIILANALADGHLITWGCALGMFL